MRDLGRRTRLRLRGMAQLSPLAENKVQVAAVHKQPARLADDEHRVSLVDRIGEHDDPARHAAVPEGDWNDAAAFHLALEPLDDEARGEQPLAGKSDGEPDPFRREQGVHRDQRSVTSTASRKRFFSQSTPKMSCMPTTKRSQTPYFDFPCIRRR